MNAPESALPSSCQFYSIRELVDGTKGMCSQHHCFIVPEAFRWLALESEFGSVLMPHRPGTNALDTVAQHMRSHAQMHSARVGFVP